MLDKITHYGMATFYNAILGIFSIFILTKFYSFTDFGKIALFILIGNISGNILTFGLGKATQRFYFESLKENTIESFKILNFSNFIMIFFIFLISFPIFIILKDEFNIFFKIEESFSFLTFAYVYGFFNIIYFYFLNLIISQKKSKKYLILAISYATSNFLLTIFLIFYFSENYLSRLYSLLIVNIIFCFLTIFLNKDYLSFKISFIEIKKSLNFSLPGFPSTLVGILHSNFDKSFLASIKSLSSLGILDISNRIGLISKMFIDFIIQAWIPEFMTNANKGEKNKIVENYRQIIFFFGIFIFLLSLFSKELLWILTSEEFYIAKIYIPLICLGVFINHLFTLVASPSITYVKKLQKNFIPSLVALISSIILNIILVPVYGVLGVIISMIVSGFFSGYLLFYSSQKSFYLDISNYFIIKNIITLTLFISFIYVLNYFQISYIYEFIIKIILILAFIKLTLDKDLNLNEFKTKFKNYIFALLSK